MYLIHTLTFASLPLNWSWPANTDDIIMDTSFLEKPRQVTAEWHLRQVMKWLEYDNGRELDNVLVYASFELRCAIERTIFENLLLVKEKLTPEEQKRCRSKEGMLDLMRESDSLYRKTFEFTKMFFSIVLGVNKIKPINTAFFIQKMAWTKHILS